MGRRIVTLQRLSRVVALGWAVAGGVGCAATISASGTAHSAPPCAVDKVKAPEAGLQWAVYVVRHAEKLPNGSDPELSAEGEARADALAHTLAATNIAGVYVTAYRRTAQTGQRVAEQASVAVQQYAAGDAEGLVREIRSRGKGSDGAQNYLVVGHSNTVDDIVRALGGQAPADLNEGRYDRLYLVQSIAGVVVTTPLRYGQATP